MTKKTRYFVLLAGVIFFLIAAPLIVLYVRGLSYNFATGSFEQTGILALRVEPKNVGVFFNNKLRQQGSGDVKFITPGEYQINLKAPGYSGWGKRLTVTAGQVTWASPPNSSIYLFFNQAKQQDLGQGVLDFSINGGTVAFLTAQSITLASVNNPNTEKNFSLPKAVDTFLATDSQNNFLLSASATPKTLVLFNSQSGSFTDLSNLFNSPVEAQLDNSGNLLALSGEVLYKIDATKKIKSPLFAGVKAFYLQNNNIYFVQQSGGQLVLNLSPSPFSQSQQLLNNLPTFSKGKLIVTYEKQIFLLADGNLYQANSAMDQLADGISELNVNSANSSLDFLHNGQFDYFNTFGQNLNFVTRSAQNLKNPVVKNNIGYAFFADSRGLNAIELDTRDNQNQYLLYPGANIKKFVVDSNGQSVVVLDGDKLENLTIR